MSGLIERAATFAEKAHEGQVRKYTGEPYFNHCKEVAEIVSTVTGSEWMIAAAFLHDVVEDTPYTLCDIQKKFGTDIRFLVWWLTDKSKPEDGNRATRKAIDHDFIGRAPNSAKTITCADLISNTRSIVERDLKFAKVYLEEKRLLMPCLVGADVRLWNAANELAQLA